MATAAGSHKDLTDSSDEESINKTPEDQLGSIDLLADETPNNSQPEAAGDITRTATTNVMQQVNDRLLHDTTSQQTTQTMLPPAHSQATSRVTYQGQQSNNNSALLAATDGATLVTQVGMRVQREQHMATRVRKEATDTIFRAVKFLNTENLVRKTLTKLSALMNVEEDLRYEWELVYRKDLIFAINNKRNSVAQDCKAKLKGTSDVCTYVCVCMVDCCI